MSYAVTFLVNVTLKHFLDDAPVCVVHVITVSLISYNVLPLGQPITANYGDPIRAGRCYVSNWN